MSFCRKFALLFAISLGVSVSGTAFAQDGLEEIVVTARKVGESIQDVPLSITAYGAEEIKERQIVDIEDLAAFTPGLHRSNDLGDRSDPSLRFRGMDPPSFERQKQLASSFVDGVYLPGGSNFMSMNDIERVEVVKGPQSAFFGRATFSGAINFITKTPGNDWGGDVQAIVGDNGRKDLWLSAEGPIVEDKLFFRASARSYTYDGAWPNAFPGSESLGAQETSSGALTLYATPTDNVSIKLRHVYSEDRDGMGTQWIVSGEDNNCGSAFGTPGLNGTASYFCGTLSRGLVEQGSRGLAIDTSPPVDTRYKTEMGLERFTNLTSLEVNVDIGDYTLTSVSGNFSESTANMRELITNEILAFSEWEDKSFSQELRIASNPEDRFRWMIGLYYLDLTYFDNGQGGFPCPGTGPFCFDPTIGAVSARGGRGLFGVTPSVAEDVENRAIFGSVSFDVTEQLTLNLELRREEEELENASSVTQEAMPLDPNDPINTAQPFGGADIPLEAEFTATLPRFIIDYKFRDDTTIYASYAEGNNPGGFNPEVIQLEPTVALPAFQAATGIGYQVEQGDLKSYEFGVKHTLAEGRGYINGAVYFLDWNNQVYRGFLASADSNGDGVFIQGSDRLGGQIDYNGNGSSEITGFEIAAGYAFNDNWRASFSYNYNDTEITELLDAQHNRVWGSFDASGKEIARSPKTSAAFSVDFNMPTDAWGGGDWFARWDGSYQSESYTWVINLAETEAALLHNLRGGWRNDRYAVTAWIENVTDDDSVLAATRFTGSFLTGQLGYRLSLPEPRTYGLTFSARFGAN